jgi:SAM-dependent methyltransferase
MPTRFHDLREDYATRMLDFSRQMGDRELWSVVWQFPLYAEEYALARCIKIADLLRSTLDVPGNVAEFGSWQGANLLYMAKLLRIFSPHAPKRTYCFESFKGLDTFTPPDGDAKRFSSAYQGSREHLEEVIELFEMQQEIVIYEGDVAETLPRVLTENQALRFSFIYCDVDLYKPTVDILDNVHERLSAGGLLVFDEYGWDEFPGETLAVDEFLRAHPGAYETQYLPDTRQPTLALKKL